jgi:hypothetical protein
VGRSTFIEGEIESPGRFRSEGGLTLVCSAAAAGAATLALRPERIILAMEPRAGMDNSLPGVVEFISYLGATIDMHVRISPKERVVVQIPNRAGSLSPKGGGQVYVAWPATNGIVFLATGLDLRKSGGNDDGDNIHPAGMSSRALPRSPPSGLLVAARRGAQAKGKVVVGTWGGLRPPPRQEHEQPI